jgi:hypothetical protein
MPIDTKQMPAPTVRFVTLLGIFKPIFINIVPNTKYL